MLGSLAIAVAGLSVVIAYVHAWRIYRRGWNECAKSEYDIASSKDELRARALARLRRRQRSLRKVGSRAVV
jgi:hypothetical protein